MGAVPLAHADGNCTGEWSVHPVPAEKAGRCVLLCEKCGAVGVSSPESLDDAMTENFIGYLLTALTNEGAWIQIHGRLPRP